MKAIFVLVFIFSFYAYSNEEFNIINSQEYFKNNMFESGHSFLIFENTELLKSVNYKIYYLINLSNLDNKIKAHYNWHSNPKRIEVSVSLDRFLNFNNEKEIHQSIAWHEYYHVLSEDTFKDYYPKHFNNFFENQNEYYRLSSMRYEVNKNMQMNEFLADLYSFRKMNGKLIQKNFDEYRDHYNDSCSVGFFDYFIEFKTHPCVDDRLDFIRANRKESKKISKENFEHFYNNFMILKGSK